MPDHATGGHDIYLLLEDRDEETLAAVETYFDLETRRPCWDDVRVSAGGEEQVLETWTELRSYLLDHPDEQQMLPWLCEDPEAVVTLDFTEDGYLIVGYARDGLSSMEAARTMFDLVEEFSAVMAFVGWVEAPPGGGRPGFVDRLQNGVTCASFRRNAFR